MKKLFSLLALASISALVLPDEHVFAAKSTEVAVLNCEIDIVSTSHPNLVLAYSNSAGAPTIGLGTDCAQALADLLNAGFKVKSINASDTSLRITYLLTTGK
jgi:hypothetical protein